MWARERLGSSRLGLGWEGDARCMASHWPHSASSPVLSKGKTNAHTDVLLGRWMHWQLQQDLSHCHAALVSSGRGSFRLLPEGCCCSWAKKSSMLLRFYSPKMKQGAHTAKKGREPHIVTGDASYSEQKCHPGLRYHGRASSKILLLKETVLGAQGQEPLLSDWFGLKAWGTQMVHLIHNLGKLIQQELPLYWAMAFP